MHEGGANYVKEGGTEKKVGETKNLKREGKLDQGVGTLKSWERGRRGGGARAPLQTRVRF